MTVPLRCIYGNTCCKRDVNSGLVAQTGAWMRCLCHSDVNDRMNNARPHYAYCRDDVNPSLRPARPRAER